MQRSYLLCSSLFVLGSCSAFAQLGGPVMGYLPDGGSSRAKQGIPAAGAVSGALDAGRDLALVETAPGRALALGIAAASGEVLLLTPDASGSSVTAVALPGAAAGASRIVFSPSGTSAALWFSSNGHLQVVTGLTSSPAVRDTDASFLGGDPGALAVSDDGTWAVGSWAQQVYAFGPASAVNVLPVSGAVQALGFFHSAANLAVVTAEQVVTITDVGGGAVPKVIWTKPEGAVESAPQVAVGVAASFDNSRLTVAASGGSLFTFDVATGEGRGADCGCAPTALAGLGDSLFRLTGAKAGSLKVFDAATNEIWIVPLAVEAVGGQQ